MVLLDTLTQDIRFGFRQLGRARGFAAAAALTLALGIGANATIFNWINRILLEPLPGVNSERLHYVRWAMPEGGRGRSSTSWPTFLDLRERNRTLAQIAVGRATAFSLGEGARPERTFGMLVSANYFDMLGVKPQRGRAFRPEEDRNPGTHAVAVISHALWLSRFGGDPGIVGREVRINTHRFTVIGVTPPGFQGSTVGLRHDVWVPAIMCGEIMGGVNRLRERSDRWLETYIRLKPGVSMAQAEQDLNNISAQLSREIFNSDRFARVDAVPVWRHAAGQVLGPVLLLMAAVAGVVLLIACANVGNLLLARAAGRSREFALRVALGAGRGRVIRQLLVENGLLALAGGLLALATVPLTSGLLSSFAPPADFAISMEARTDWRVLVFTLAISALATLLFGLAPAWRASRPDLIEALKSGEGPAGGGSARSRLRSGLAVAQVALSLVLLVGAGLLLRSLRHAANMSPGFDPRNVLVMGVDLRPNGYDDRTGPGLVRQALERIGALPGVAAVSTVRRVPLGLGGSSSTGFSVDGYTPQRDEPMVALINNAGPDYFRTMGTPLAAGREFRPDDDAAHAPVVVINETLARRYFAGGRDPVGRRLSSLGRDYTIIGVARDSKFQTLDEPPAPFFWVANLQVNASETNFLVRTSGGAGPLSVAKAVERELAVLNASMPVYGVRPLEDSISAVYIPQRMGGWMLGLFGGLALLLAAVGLSGVLAFVVAMRRREVGIRMALGATPGQVVGLVLADGLRLTALGIAIGMALALGLSRFLSKLLFGVSPTDAATLSGVTALLAAVALAACYLPARRASRIEPMAAIRG